MSEPDFTIGIEEEYLLVDPETGALKEAPDSLIQECMKDLGARVSPEFLRCQIEIGTGICSSITQARQELRELRAAISRRAGEHGLAPIAAACHPFADWKDLVHTDKERYNDLEHDLAAVSRRMVICGMHVHVGLPEPEMRIDLMNQMVYFLPHLLALSGSSPYWQGVDTGLTSYRMTIFDNMPRTGLPPYLASWSEFERSVDLLSELDIIEDASKIWWDLRPSAQFPTLESRICDVCPRLDMTLTIAALTRCIARFLWRLSRKNQRWRTYEPFLISENRWRAQRYGVSDGLIDFGRRAIVPFPELLGELLALIHEDAEALNCVAEVEAARDLIKDGNASDHQRAVYKAAIQSGADKEQALKAVVDHLIDAFHADL
ncbi:carboxylate-amine ligase [Paracoccaceae bacterium GXU_MW_L88]